jgi:hypothetical protein
MNYSLYSHAEGFYTSCSTAACCSGIHHGAKGGESATLHELKDQDEEVRRDFCEGGSACRELVWRLHLKVQTAFHGLILTLTGSTAMKFIATPSNVHDVDCLDSSYRMYVMMRCTDSHSRRILDLCRPDKEMRKMRLQCLGVRMRSRRHGEVC